MTGIERLRKLAQDYKNVSDTQKYLGINVRREADLLIDIADQIERETQQRNDPADVTSCDAYDLLPPDEREAISWVREHGGIDEVKEEWNRRSNLKRQLDTAQTKVERQQRHIEFVQGKCRERQNRVVGLKETVEFLKFNNSNFRALQADVAERLGFTRYGDDYEPDELLDTLDKRLMPEGMEWLVEAWPRFEDGEPVKFGDKVPTIQRVSKIGLFSDGSFTLYNGFDSVPFKRGERVKRPAPKVLDADGAEIDPDQLTHRAPVIAADGKPLREGETVWSVDTGASYTVRRITDELIPIKCDDTVGLPISLHPSQLTHELPESWERLEEDAKDIMRDIAVYLGDYSQSDFKEPGDSIQDRVRDLVRRAKALAERGQ